MYVPPWVNTFPSSSYRSIRLCVSPFPSYSPCLVWRRRVVVATITATRCSSGNNPTMLLAAVWTMVVVVVVVVLPLVRIIIHLFGALFSRSQPLPQNCQRNFFLCLLWYMCVRFRGCPVLPHIELLVSARYHKTRVCTAAPAASAAYQVPGMQQRAA